MNIKELQFVNGAGGEGLEGEYMADINIVGLNKGIIACQADDKETAERLREWVRHRLTWDASEELKAENADLRQRLEMVRELSDARAILTQQTTDALESSIVAWAYERGIFDSSTPTAQMLKTTEELGELAGGIAKGKPEVIKDSIGDVVVTLILQAHMHGWTLAECLGVAYAEISKRKGKMIGGVFVKSDDLPTASSAGVADVTWDMHGIMPDVAIDGANLSIDAGDSEGGYCD